MAPLVAWLAFFIVALGVGLWAVLRFVARRCASASITSRALAGQETIGFFHPYAHAGGGGERVLWCAIKALQEHDLGIQCVVYTGDTKVAAAELLEHAATRFGIQIEAHRVYFVFLHGRAWVDASTWPHFTLLGQSLGSILLAWEALCHFHPDVFIDTMGYAFTLPIFALLAGSRVCCYVHYPTISTDMLARVRSRSVGVCNDATIARSSTLSFAKLIYYRAFAALYGFAGRFAEVVMVNSSWTRGHIDSLWRVPQRTTIVFPPCDTAALSALPLERQGNLVVSLAQFRPEKDHALQLRSFARFLASAPQHRGHVRLVLAGGCRDAGDRQRVEELRRLAQTLGLRESDGGDVTFRTNLALQEVKELLGQAAVGLHTMREEHFGINVVEFMAAGAVALAHGSGGPAMDIVTPWSGQKTGFLATDEGGYAAALEEIFALSSEQRLEVSKAAREAVRERFAQDAFERAIVGLVGPLRRAQTKS